MAASSSPAPKSIFCLFCAAELEVDGGSATCPSCLAEFGVSVNDKSCATGLEVKSCGPDCFCR